MTDWLTSNVLNKFLGLFIINDKLILKDLNITYKNYVIELIDYSYTLSLYHAKARNMNYEYNVHYIRGANLDLLVQDLIEAIEEFD